ncbi:efflux transporter outer membrane subunit [Thermodesulfatator atlanticus]|uniref:efflux transporter outer membrane subunit n=1 Tax=Thermodesulfatator atlanticus TaxID=501497 RepID=UPI0003B37493|nr:efflux transporter outer membrane subunit [Thermodesulfatator atlanticus]
MKKTFFLLLIFCLLTGCAPKPPKPSPSIPLPKSYYFAASKEKAPFVDRWWENFRDEKLNELVAELLSSNLSLREAAERVRESAAFLKEARAYRFPKLNFSFGANRERAYSPYGPSFISGSFSASLFTSYELDIWQKFSHAKRAAAYKLLANEENLKALAQSLVAELVSKYVAASYLACEKEVLAEQLATQKRYLNLLRERYQLGLVDASLLEQEERLLAGLELEKENLEARGLSLRQEIALLLGRYPRPTAVSSEICMLELPAPKPGLPADLLKRRPDIRAAKEALLAAGEEVAAKKADLFPSITLTAKEGRISNALATLLRSENRLWQLAATLTQPIFDAGARKARVKEAYARFRLQEARYAQTILQAFYEVENALMLENSWRKRLALVSRQEKAACKEASIRKARYLLGTASSLDYLKAKNFCLEQKRQKLAAENSLMQARISLYRALGGGFSQEDGS